MICPASTKSGIAKSEKLSKPVAIRWAIVVTLASESIETIMVKRQEIPIDQATGTPIPNNTKNTNTRIKTSIIRLNIFED